MTSLTRRQLLLLSVSGLVAAACKSEPPPRSARPVTVPAATVAPTLVIPKPPPPRPTATPLPTLAALPDGARSFGDEQSRVIPPLRPRPGPYVTRTIPPERLIIPRLELDARVIAIGIKTDKDGQPMWETAAFAVGHHLGSSNPGEPGNVVLSGHISSPREGAIFQRLPQIKAGDGVVLATSLQQYLYRVRDVSIVVPSAVEILASTPVPIATLITCYPDGVYSHRLIVRAEAV